MYWRRWQRFVSIYIYILYVMRIILLLYTYILYYTAAKGVSLWRHARTSIRTSYYIARYQVKIKTKQIPFITVYKSPYSVGCVQRLLCNSRTVISRALYNNMICNVYNIIMYTPKYLYMYLSTTHIVYTDIQIIILCAIIYYCTLLIPRRTINRRRRTLRSNVCEISRSLKITLAPLPRLPTSVRSYLPGSQYIIYPTTVRMYECCKHLLQQLQGGCGGRRTGKCMSPSYTRTTWQIFDHQFPQCAESVLTPE